MLFQAFLSIDAKDVIRNIQSLQTTTKPTALNLLSHSMISHILNDEYDKTHVLAMPANTLRQAQTQALLNLVDTKRADIYALIECDDYVTISQNDYFTLFHQTCCTDQPIDIHQFEACLNPKLPEEHMYYLLPRDKMQLKNFCPVAAIMQILKQKNWTDEEGLNIIYHTFPEFRDCPAEDRVFLNLYSVTKDLLNNFVTKCDNEVDYEVTHDQLHRFIFTFTILPMFYNICHNREPLEDLLLQLNMIGASPADLLNSCINARTSKNLDFDEALTLMDQVVITNPSLIEAFTELVTNNAQSQEDEEDDTSSDNDNDDDIDPTLGPKYYS